MSDTLYAELSFGSKTLRLNGAGGPSADGLCIEAGGVEGWYSTPDAKVSSTEMETGDGAHAVQEQDILYSARTVTLHWVAVGASRPEAVEANARLLSTAHSNVRLRLVDASSDTYCVGYTAVSSDAKYMRGGMTGTLTLVCPDPRRLSTSARRVQLMPTVGDMGAGLDYGSGGKGLAYPVGYGKVASDARNVATVENRGTSRAYPVITVNGSFPNGVRIDCGQLSLAYSQPVGAVPLVLDCRTRTANVGGTDMTRHLTSRGFPTVPAGGSATLSLQSAGSGWVTVECRDTYV